MKAIVIRPGLCKGCKNCQFACMVAHSEGKSPYFLDLTDQGNQPRNTVLLGYDGAPSPLTCRHCQEAPCVISCPSGAMYRDSDSGLVLHNQEQCAGCWMCVMSCPYDLISPDSRGRAAVKCDFCIGNEQPYCVENCPTGALSIEEIEDSTEGIGTEERKEEKTRYLIIGASAAGLACAAAIRREDPWGQVTVIAEDSLVYSRCLLKDIISGARNKEQLNFIGENFFDDQGIEFIPGKKVTAVDPRQKMVFTLDGWKTTYDKLLIATGAKPVLPPVENLASGRQVFVLRSLEDAEGIIDSVETNKRVIILGGGLVGLEAAEALVAKGVRVTVIEQAEHLLPLQLDSYASSRYAELFRSHGVGIITGQRADKIQLDEDSNVLGVELDDKGYLPCDLIIAAAGVKPEISSLSDIGIAVNKGIIVDQQMRTTIPDVYAAGDVCETLETLTGKVSLTPIWPAAVQQGEVAGLNMVGKDVELVGTFAYQNAMSFFGLPTISFGWPEPPDDSYQVETDVSPDYYRKVIYKKGRLVGAIFQGDLSGAGTFGTLIKKRIDTSKYQGKLLSTNYTYYLSPELVIRD
ncbi:MAG: FAD-dependent oxidoreductase [Syntrophomonadaceae bacterium]|nr:FAD-dependent oxidoreductase [Syntrophomonadaceae bacterium]